MRSEYATALKASLCPAFMMHNWLFSFVKDSLSLIYPKLNCRGIFVLRPKKTRHLAGLFCLFLKQVPQGGDDHCQLGYCA